MASRWEGKEALYDAALQKRQQVAKEAEEQVKKRREQELAEEQQKIAALKEENRLFDEEMEPLRAFLWSTTYRTALRLLKEGSQVILVTSGTAASQDISYELTAEGFRRCCVWLLNSTERSDPRYSPAHIADVVRAAIENGTRDILGLILTALDKIAADVLKAP